MSIIKSLNSRFGDDFLIFNNETSLITMQLNAEFFVAMVSLLAEKLDPRELVEMDYLGQAVLGTFMAESILLIEKIHNEICKEGLGECIEGQSNLTVDEVSNAITEATNIINKNNKK